MESRRKISAAMMLTCFFAMALNAFVVLTCDCVSCHTHTTQACHCGDCSHLEGDTFFSQHCECTHTHENLSETGISIDNERILKQMKIVVAALPRAIAVLFENSHLSAPEGPKCPLSLPLEEFPPLAVGALRAPPVFA